MVLVYWDQNVKCKQEHVFKWVLSSVIPQALVRATHCHQQEVARAAITPLPPRLRSFKKIVGDRNCGWNSFHLPSVFKFLLRLAKSEESVAQLCPTLCNPKDCSPPSTSVHGILQPRIVEWVAFSRGSSWPKAQTWVSCIAGRFFFLPSELPEASPSRMQPK